MGERERNYQGCRIQAGKGQLMHLRSMAKSGWFPSILTAPPGNDLSLLASSLANAAADASSDSGEEVSLQVALHFRWGDRLYTLPMTPQPL